ncbi:hypothetical protein DPMN_056774 [Dreissena polymorpha]|uniref:G-protein coupled receptors family 1 profile domain-containing protein n=1 Tax=Dreissena polymorpha TaxID=45954 RepID=A0A9D4CV23_DREPO|nr:hypothetical protein DPMN_056774 [Dreissena polymorpha]
MPSNVEASVAQVTVGTVFLILMVIAALVNLSVVMTFYCRSRLHTPTNVLIIGCVFFDVVGVFIGFPFVIVSCFSGHWYFGEEWCKVYGVLMATVGAANISILTAIAVHRYFVMLHRARARSFTNEKAIIVIVVCIGHGLLSGLLPIIGWGNITREPSGLTCGPDWTNTNMSIRSYNVSFMVVNGLVPLGIICACYTQILIKVSMFIS